MRKRNRRQGDQRPPVLVLNPVLAVTALALLVVSPSVFAYLDPSTGSMVVSAIVGIIASLALAIKTYWYKLKRLFKRGGASETSTDQSTDS